MKTALALLSLILLTNAVKSEDMLYMGKYYKDVRFVFPAKGGKVIVETSSDGVVTVPWTALSTDFRRQNKERYEEALRALAETDVARAMGNDLLLKIKVSAWVKNITEVETDLSNYVGKFIWLAGEFEASTVYGSRYEYAQNTHFAFSIKDDKFNSAYVYLSRTAQEAAALRKIGLLDKKKTMLCLVQMLPHRVYSNDSSIHAELLFACPF